MATVLFSAAGAAAGGAIGGSFLGVSSVALGQAAGAIAGSLLDQTILGSGSAAVETGRARSLRLQTSTEGTPIPTVYGRMRVSGQVIWATRFRENVRTTTQGGKATGGQRVREYSYSISFAVGLCEGKIDRIGRIWADGKLLDLAGINFRIYEGDETQLPDPKIEAVEGAGNVPAYRGLAYAVFEDLPLGQYGNRIPQLSFEVFRSSPVSLPEIGGPRIDSLVQAVSLSPGTGEFALDPNPSQTVFPAGGATYSNINNAFGEADLIVSLDQLESELPAARKVSLIVSWFGSDLRCGQCTVEPRIEEPGRATRPEEWSVAGLTTSTARPVSLDPNGRPNFGGSPSDRSVVRAISEMKNRGIAVMLYPFLLMDIPAGNGLSNPYGQSEQPAFPWRGRITLDTAPGRAGTADKTPAAAADVDAFFGTASASDFTVSGDAVSYSGPAEWGWRRFVLHLAALGAAAGGLDSICIGTEMRGLTTLRDSRTTFPAVAHFVALAAEVRALLPNAKITYAADWSEYFGYQPQDGTGDVLFHLDDLWADANIDVVGIDDYTPLSDWRHTADHADSAAQSVYALPYLQAGVEGGEYYDWYYPTDADRTAQNRVPITDGAANEPWVFRAKDIRNWWSNPHHNRVDGVRSPTPTAWVPMSKPVWLTETGCPAVDLGANQPNVFLDAKSSESALPHASRGARDDEIQRRFLQAKLGYWSEPANNPQSPLYGGPMLPADRIYVWTWDARPWPDFPVRQSLWADGPSHRVGHWISGRIAAGSLAEIVADICLTSGLTAEDFDVSRLFGLVEGYLIDRTGGAREALQPLMQALAFDAYESAGRLTFVSRDIAEVGSVETNALVPGPEPVHAPVERTAARGLQAVDSVRLQYVQAENDYRVGAAEARLPNGDLLRIAETSLQLSLPGSRAQEVAERWLAEALRARETASFTLPPSGLAFEPGDLISLPGAGEDEVYRIDRITDLGAREIEAVRVEPGLYVHAGAAERTVEPELAQPPGPISAIVLDLPLADRSETDHQPRLAVVASPWPGSVSVYKSQDGEGFDFATEITKPALIGTSLSDLAPGAPARWHRTHWDVIMPAGSVVSASRLSVLNGANLLAVEVGNGWEIMQFRQAELVGPDTYRLSMLLRGLRGTQALSTGTIAAGARIVVIDDALAPMPVSTDEIGVPRIWRIGPTQQDPSQPSYIEKTITAEAIGLRPFAPAHVKAERAGGDIVLEWIRTTRIGGGNLASVAVPLGEDREAYRVTIRSGDTLIRQSDTTTAAFAYTTAMQAADGAAGTLTIGVAQLSATFGYGPERVIEIDV